MLPPLTSILTSILAGAFAVLAFAFAVRSWRWTRLARFNLSAEGRARARAVRRLGPLAGREYFGDAGWAAQQRAQVCLSITIPCAVTAVLLIVRR